MMLAASIFAFLEMAKPRNQQLKQWMLYISAFIAIILAGFREGVGGDWGAYQCYHALAGQMGFNEYIQLNDPGYMAFGWVFAQMNLGVWAINLFCAFILITGIFRLATTTRYQNMFFLSATPYLIIVVGMGYSRQSAAIGVVCHAVTYLLQEKRTKTLLFAITSLAFHKSAAFGIMPIFVTYGKRLWQRALIIAMAFPAVAIFVLLEGYQIAQRGYIEAEYQSSGALIRVLQIFLCGVWYLLFLNRRFESKPNDVFYAFAILAALSLPALLISPSSTLIDRLMLYLIPFQCYVLARTPEVFSRGPGRITIQSGIIIINIAIFSVWMTSAQHLGSWINYNNYLWSGSSLAFLTMICR